jgi:RND family efflux transporter MFP subunit
MNPLRSRLLRATAPWLVGAAVLLHSVRSLAADASWVTGVTEPVKDVTLAFPIVGVVGSRPLEEGATVRKDQVVIELDKQLEELDLERKRLARELAASELERLKSLALRNAISVSKEEIEKKRSEFEIAKVDVELAAAVLKRRQLISPIDGQVAQFFKDVGEKCEDQQPVVRIVDTRRFHLVANLEPRLAQPLKLNQKVRVEVLVGDSPITVEGTLIYLSPVADAASGLLRIKAVFENPEGKIRPGIAGRLRID